MPQLTKSAKMGGDTERLWVQHCVQARQHHANADVLSRLPVPNTEPEKKTKEQVLDALGDTLIDTMQIKRWTAKDVILSQVEYTLNAGLHRQRIQAISTEKDGTEYEGWVCALGCKSNYTHQRQRQNTAAPASDSHRHVKDEKSG